MKWGNEQFEQTEFNSNLATLMRIDDALKFASKCSVTDDFENWFKALGILRREAIVKMKPEEVTNCNVLWHKLEVDVGLVSRCKNVNSFNTRIDNKLDEFEIFLRSFMNKKGMLLRDAQDLRGL